MKRNPDKHIYGICGKKEAGKDTFAHFVIAHNPSYKIVHFADDLKDMARTIWGLSDAQVTDTQAKEAPIQPIAMDNYLYQMRSITGLSIQAHQKIATTPRELLQFFGSDYIRAVCGTYWVQRLVDKVRKIGHHVLIPDTRFINEADVIRQLGGHIIRIQRAENTAVDGHISETEQAAIDADVTLVIKTGDRSLSRDAAYSLACSQWRCFRRFDYLTFEKGKALYLDGAPLRDIGTCLGIQKLADQGTKSIFYKLLCYYGIPYSVMGRRNSND